jgi:3-oxoacyl-[acyl-carrier protein] reductase
VPEKIIDESVKFLGGLDLLVTNAGGPPAGAFDSFDEATWEKAVNLSFMSHVRLIRAALPHLRKSKAASVLTMTSYSVKQPLPNLVLSNSVRLATIGLTKSLALELGSEGIRFNSILPGTIETDRIRELDSFRAQKNGTTLEQELAIDAQKSVFGRIGQPEEFANAAVFLLSPAASYLTGVMLTVDGGQYKSTSSPASHSCSDSFSRSINCWPSRAPSSSCVNSNSLPNWTLSISLTSCQAGKWRSFRAARWPWQ